MKHCTNCQSFAWWDGDFVCTTNMKVIQKSEDGKFYAKIDDKAEDCIAYDFSPICEEDYHKIYEEFEKSV